MGTVARGDRERLLRHPGFRPSEAARADLERGGVDPRLVAVLLALVDGREIEVSTIRTGHPMGPTAPNGRPNSHHHGRAADITAVGGKPVLGNGGAPELLDAGRALRGLPPGERPDRIMGPEEWHEALGYPRGAGFIGDAFHNRIHADHLHVGFGSEDGTDNRE